MQTHAYTWKVGMEFSSSTTMRTNRPVTENTVIFDLYDGTRYRIRSVYPAKSTDKAWDSMPDMVLHAWPEGALPEDELSKLRERLSTCRTSSVVRSRMWCSSNERTIQGLLG